MSVVPFNDPHSIRRLDDGFKEASLPEIPIVRSFRLEAAQSSSLPVPSYRQASLTCGPTCMRMVLNYWGAQLPNDDVIIRDIGGIHRYGVTMISLVRFARRMGYNVRAYSERPELAKGAATKRNANANDIFKLLVGGVPVIVPVESRELLGRPSHQNPGIGHGILITGFDGSNFAINDPSTGRVRRVEEHRLLLAWHRKALTESAYLLGFWPKGYSVR